jgi:hypothetical protein
MAIAELIEQGLTEEQAIRVAVEHFGMDEVEARFVLSVELGKVDGDIVIITEESNA